MEAEEKMFFNLSEPLEFSKGGEFLTTQSLEIDQPAASDYGPAMRLAQRVAKCLFLSQKIFADVPTTSQKEGAAEIDAEGMAALMLLSDTPITDYFGSLSDILLRTCTVDGEIRLTADLFDKIGISDKKKLLAEYVVKFTLPLTI